MPSPARPSVWPSVWPSGPPIPARHILTYAQTLRGGGVERAQLRLARDWIAAGRRVTLVIGDAHGPLAAELPMGIELVSLGSARMRAFAALPRIVRATTPDIVFCPGNHYTGIAAWTRLRLGRACPPIVGKLSNAPHRADHRRLVDTGHRAWLALHGRFLDHVVAMTPATAADAMRAMRLPADRMSVIANPPAMAIPGAVPPQLPVGRYIIGVGRLVPQKRWDRLIAALAAVADRSVSLVILGEGPERDALMASARAFGVERRVFLPGYAADPLPALADAALCALTSDFEGVPGVLREALSVGTPVVATESSVSVREIVCAPALGDVVARDDPAALVAALDRWLAPDAARPAPVPPPGADSAERYLALFDSLVTA